MLQISILPLNSPKIEVFSPNFAFLDESFPPRKKISDNFPTAQNLGGGNSPSPSHCLDSPCDDAVESNALVNGVVKLPFSTMSQSVRL